MTASLDEQFRSQLPAVADVSQIDVVTLQQIQMTHIAGLEMSAVPIYPAIQLRDEPAMRGAYTLAEYKLSVLCQTTFHSVGRCLSTCSKTIN